jgi:DNA polymerase-1
MDIRYQSIFAQIKSEHGQTAVVQKRNKNSDILIIDGVHNFIRNWVVVPTLNDNGEHVGGTSGFLITLGHAIKLLRPTRVIIVFDGQGGSLRRQKIYPDYKAKRKMTVRVNRAYEDMSDPEIERKAMLAQMGKLVEFLRSLPVSILAIDYIEADDTIGYITTQMFLNAKITIMSGDRDFLQLVNERVSVWSPIKKKIYGVSDVINQYGVHPTNFVYYRILEGDKSDNINGIRGIALKTALKMFPMLAETKEYSIEEMLKFSRDKANEKKAYANILENAEIVTRNYQLMQLKTPDFSPTLQMQIAENVERIYEYNKFHFIQSLTTHGMHSAIPNYHVWLQEVFYPLHVMATEKNVIMG